MTMETFGLAI